MSATRCLLLDIGLPNLNGLELQQSIARDQPETPIIFVTGYDDVAMTVQAMKAGAFEFLTKPFVEDVLLTAIRFAASYIRAITSTERAATC
jgi:FixJ family two-component response regulator